MRELIVDLFAGGGGASEGIRLALGRNPDVAINHDPLAVAMHRANHPDTHHLCQDMWQVSPTHATRGLPVGLLWASPDCTHFSKAKGGKPKRDAKRRELAWTVEKWAREVRPRVIGLENVEEFLTWGPLDKDGMPIKAQAGEFFQAWRRAIRRLGYKMQWRELRACDYGAPTIRKRLFLIARCDGRPIVWPKPTHGDPRAPGFAESGLLPWRTAAECIDWSIACPSIFERKKPLAEATMRRISKGLRRYVIDHPRPFIVTCNHAGGEFRGQGLEEPMKTVTASRDAHGLVTPYFVPRYGERPGQEPRCRSVEEPLPTVVTTDNGAQLVAPYLVPNTTGHAPGSAEEPVATLTTGGQQILAAPYLTEHANGSSQRTFDADEPLRTQCAQVKGGHFALVAAFMAQHNTGVVGHEAGEPVSTISTKGSQQQLVLAHLDRQFGASVGSDVDLPAPTTTAGGGGKTAVVTSHMLKLRGSCQDGQTMEEPAPTITAGGTHAVEVRAFLIKYYGAAQDPRMEDPLHTVTTKDRFGLVTVTIDGEPYVIADIGMRMLSPRELFRAQGFPDSYVIDLSVDGRRLSKADQVRMCGNSVCPPAAAAIVAANYVEDQAEIPQRRRATELPLLAMAGQR